MLERIKAALAWAKRNERHLSGIFFLGGFVGDIATFTLLNVSLVNLLFAGYVVLAALCTLGDHALSSGPDLKETWLLRVARVLLPLGVQFFVGSVLSGSLIFYTKSSVLLVSWPFLLLLALVFFGNELLRDYRAHLAFQTVLLFFGVYAYAIFALPLLVGTLGPVVFLESTAVALGVFLLFLSVLFLLGRARLAASFSRILIGSLSIVLILNAAYFTGLVPPLPLSVKDAGIYQTVTHAADGYLVTGEAPQPWWDLRPQTVHHTPGTPLYAFSSVFAPIRFSTTVVHVWEWYDPSAREWVEKNRVAFALSGGRDGGYRGYSLVENPAAGRWRLSVETPSGQVVGRVAFVVVEVATEPALETDTK